MQHGIAGFAQIVHFELVGGLDIGADEHEFLDAEVVERLGQRLGRGDRRAAAGLLDDVDDRLFVGQPAFHGVGGAVKNNDARLYVGSASAASISGFSAPPAVCELAGHA